jgi:cytochrome P450
MKYLDAVFSETIRLNGSTLGLFTRKAVEDVHLGNLVVPKGSGVSQVHCANHYSEKNF